jgi:flagellar operon protein
MAGYINGIQVPFVPIERPGESIPKKEVKGTDAFNSVLQRELEKIKFSKHASQRLDSRDISLSSTQLEKLQNAVDKAEQKGAKDSLVMLNDTAFIVNIPNRTVVTALPVSEEDNIFTNIDSVVFAH